MCGICGVAYLSESRDVPLTDLRGMLNTITHRGPDDEGVYEAAGIALGARRLSIIDVDGGHQPMFNEDGSVVVVANGEIYNFRELTAALESAGHYFRTRCDTEVIVHLYEEYGEACVHHLRGMFAFAVWDSHRRRVLIARDRVGIKPLYWSDRDGRLMFASEIKALLAYPGIHAHVNYEALAAMLALRYVPSPMTMFAHIASLPPGHLLVGDEHGVACRRWWDLSFSGDETRRMATSRPARRDVSDEIGRLDELLRQVVRAHMMSDVPYGAFLSGGVDSSTIVALMTQELDRPIATFAAGFVGPGSEVSELDYARRVAKRYETDHHEVVVGAHDFVEFAQRIVWHLDEPLADDACLPNYMVARAARDHVKMVLTGEGGDELFGGYPRYLAEQPLRPLALLLPSFLRTTMARAARYRNGLARWQVAINALAQPDEARRFAAYTPLLLEERLGQLSAGRLAEAAACQDIASLMSGHLQRTDATDPLSRMLYFDFQHWLPDYLLLRGDKTAMAASIEARVPLLDHVLVEYAASLPPSLKIHGLARTSKFLLREVARPLVPVEILSRKKKGFPTPIGAWLRGGARDFCHDLLSPDLISRRDLFSKTAIARILDEHDSGAVDHGSVLWGLMSVELWHRAFLD